MHFIGSSAHGQKFSSLQVVGIDVLDKHGASAQTVHLCAEAPPYLGSGDPMVSGLPRGPGRPAAWVVLAASTQKKGAVGDGARSINRWGRGPCQVVLVYAIVYLTGWLTSEGEICKSIDCRVSLASDAPREHPRPPICATCAILILLLPPPLFPI